MAPVAEWPSWLPRLAIPGPAECLAFVFFVLVGGTEKPGRNGSPAGHQQVDATFLVDRGDAAAAQAARHRLEFRARSVGVSGGASWKGMQCTAESGIEILRF